MRNGPARHLALGEHGVAVAHQHDRPLVGRLVVEADVDGVAEALVRLDGRERCRAPRRSAGSARRPRRRRPCRSCRCRCSRPRSSSASIASCCAASQSVMVASCGAEVVMAVPSSKYCPYDIVPMRSPRSKRKVSSFSSRPYAERELSNSLRRRMRQVNAGSPQSRRERISSIKKRSCTASAPSRRPFQASKTAGDSGSEPAHQPPAGAMYEYGVALCRGGGGVALASRKALHVGTERGGPTDAMPRRAAVSL